MLLTEKIPLEISKPLKQALLLHRVRAGLASQRPLVSRASIDEVEHALGVSLPHALLAVFASTGRDPFEMVVLTEEARELDGLRPDLVAVSVEPKRLGASPLPVYWCLRSGSSPPHSPEMVRWTLDSEGRCYGLSVLDFVRACLAEGEPTAEEKIAIRGLLLRFKPAVVSQPRLPFRRVVHHRFGPGFVLREFDDGNHKVEVDFPSVGVKLLLASYVQDVPAVRAKNPVSGRRRLR